MAGWLYRIGRAAAAHRLVFIGVWLVLVAVAVVSVRALGAETNNTLTLPGTDSQAAFDLLAAKFPPQQNGANPFVLQVDRGTLSDPNYKPAVDATYRAFKASRYVYSVQNPVGKNAETAGIISDDGKIGLMPVLLNVGGGFITEELAQKILDVTQPARAAGIDVAVGGQVGSVLSAPDTKESEVLGNVSAMVILALVFGSLVAMGLPIVNAAIGLAITTSVIGMLGHIWAVPTVASTLAVMIGLGVGIDYALFLMTKHLEQLGEGVELRESIARAVASSGSAVVFAGGTVVIALLSLVVAGIPLVSTLGFASAIAVFLAVCTSITLLPAILSLVGHGVQRVRVPGFLRMRPRPQGQRRWDAWARWVAGHPWIAVGVALVILVPLIVPLFSLELGQPDVGVTPESTTERQAYDMITEGFGVGYNGPLLLAMSLDPVAEPSDAYTKKYDRATRLQKELKRENKQLNAEKRQLERQQAQLEAQERELRRQAAALQAQGAQLEREAAALEARAEAVAREIVPLAVRLRIIDARERVIRDRIDQATDPNTIRRLQRRLDHLQAREGGLRDRLNALRAQARTIADQARSLQAQKADLERQAAALDAEKAQLEREGADLQAQGDELQAQADKAKRQKQTALKLQKELTRMLTEAGGNPLGTDPRIVAMQDAVTATPGVVALSPPQVNDGGSAAIMNAIPRNAPSSDATANLVEVMRDDTLPPVTVDNGVTAHVGGTTATYVDLAAQDLLQAAPRRPDRAGPELRLPDRGVPFPAGPGPGGDHQPPDRRRRAGGVDGRVPVGLGTFRDRPGRARRYGPDRELRPPDDVRRAVRALDGLRGLPGESDPTSPRVGGGSANGGDLRTRSRGPRRHRRRADHVPGLLELHHQPRPDDQAVRRRTRDRGATRRDHGGPVGARHADPLRPPAVRAPSPARPGGASHRRRGIGDADPDPGLAHR